MLLFGGLDATVFALLDWLGEDEYGLDSTQGICRRHGWQAWRFWGSLGGSWACGRGGGGEGRDGEGELFTVFRTAHPTTVDLVADGGYIASSTPQILVNGTKWEGIIAASVHQRTTRLSCSCRLYDISFPEHRAEVQLPHEPGVVDCPFEVRMFELDLLLVSVAR